MRVRKRVWEILEIAQPGDGASRTFDLAIRSLIALNVLTVILETEMQEKSEKHNSDKFLH